MKEIEIKTEGAWRPGPGAVYPVLRKLAKQGYITIKKAGGSSTHVLYEITPAGLQNIANGRKMMRLSTERWNLMRLLFIDLMESEDLVRVVLSSFKVPGELVRMVIESDRSGLSDQDKLFVLRQYRLNLERDLTRAIASIDAMEGRPPSKGALSKGAARQ